MGKLNRLVAELRRRRVLHMTALYIVAAWVLVQVASEALPAFNMPENAIRYVWIAALVGFPIAVLFSWKYDLTASGIKRTPAADEGDTTVRPLTKVDYGILAALALVILVTALGVGQRLADVQTEVAKAPATRDIDPNSIAVLPLENVSLDPEGVYFAAGVHDALSTSLARISALMVTSSTSARRIDSSLSVPEIGRQLGVAKLLEGSVLVDGDRVRVIVQLIDAASDLHLWADTFEGEITDIISLQNDMARTIGEVIEIRLTAREEAALAKADPVDPAIHRQYLKGMYQFFQDTPEADLRGVEILKEVVRQDPDNALAHAGLAYGYANIVHSPNPPPIMDIGTKARASADLALQLDPDLAEAHTAVGLYLSMFEWDFEGAEKALLHAIDLNPNLALAHYDLAWLYELLGPEYEERALAAGDKTVELNPMSPYMVGALAWQYADACRYDEALKLAREAIRLDPEHPMGWVSLGMIYSELGQFDEAIDAHRRLDRPPWSVFVGISYAAAGLEDKAREVAKAQEAFPLAPAWIYMTLDDRETALHWLAQADKTRMSWYPWLLGMFYGSDRMVDDPVVQERAAALGLPDPRAMGCQA